jgi:hypothetical protein
MSLESSLLEKREQIVAAWCESLLSTYASEGAKFFASQKNQFANPVGHTFLENLRTLFPRLVRAEDFEEKEIRELMDGIIRIRAVQGFPPSKAVAFVTSLKGAVERVLRKDIDAPDNIAAWRDMCSRIDTAQGMAFDIYMQCREKLWELRANHLFNRTHKLLERAQVIQGKRLG